ncbi:MAG: hypothetical protein ACYDHP_12190 [Ferrimicrobium sp.]
MHHHEWTHYLSLRCNGSDQLKVRHWSDINCDIFHDREMNVARDIVAEGLRLFEIGRSGLIADERW